VEEEVEEPEQEAMEEVEEVQVDFSITLHLLFQNKHMK
jgi:hypothetical protein